MLYLHEKVWQVIGDLLTPFKKKAARILDIKEDSLSHKCIRIKPSPQSGKPLYKSQNPHRPYQQKRLCGPPIPIRWMFTGVKFMRRRIFSVMRSLFPFFQ